MFTGIIQGLGEVRARRSLTDGIELDIDLGVLAGAELGASIAINGVCSTLVSESGSVATFQYMKESLDKSAIGELQVADCVNVERSLKMGDELGGHLVSGHVDTVGQITDFVEREPWGEIRVSFDPHFAPFLIEKGSVALDGISLTVVAAERDYLTCHLVPHTIAQTNLKSKKVGDSINIEFDQFGKYILRQSTQRSS